MDWQLLLEICYRHTLTHMKTKFEKSKIKSIFPYFCEAANARLNFFPRKRNMPEVWNETIELSNFLTFSYWNISERFSFYREMHGTIDCFHGGASFKKNTINSLRRLNGNAFNKSRLRCRWGKMKIVGQTVNTHCAPKSTVWIGNDREKKSSK